MVSGRCAAGDLRRAASRVRDAGPALAAVLERAADRVVEHCVDLDPPGRQVPSDVGWAVGVDRTHRAGVDERGGAGRGGADRGVGDRSPARRPATRRPPWTSTDWMCCRPTRAAAVAGDDDLVLVVGPAGAGKTRDAGPGPARTCTAHDRPVFGLAPTAKAARVLERDTGMLADTVAKLLYEWSRPTWNRTRCIGCRRGTTVIVDEAGMIATPDLRRLVTLAQRNEWRLVLVGDPRQLQAVGRGGLFDELCRNGRVHQLEHIHRFTHPWEAEASLLLRAGDPRALDAYEAHGRIIPGTLDEHLDRDRHSLGRPSPERGHGGGGGVDQRARRPAQRRRPEPSGSPSATSTPTPPSRSPVASSPTSGTWWRRVATTAGSITSDGEPVRNRELWTVDRHPPRRVAHRVPQRRTRPRSRCPPTTSGSMCGWGTRRPSTATSPTPSPSASTSPATATTRRGLYVAVTRGRDDNPIHVITDSARRGRGPRRPRTHPRRRPGRHPRRHPTPPTRRTRPRHAATGEAVGAAGTV